MSDLFLNEAKILIGSNEKNKVVKAYLKHNGYDIDPSKTAWCAAYVGAVLNACGYEGTHKLNARSYLDWGVHISVDLAQPGDIVVLKRGILPWQGHVGFFHSETTHEVVLLGGNQDDKVCYKVFDKDRIIGVRRPSR